MLVRQSVMKPATHTHTHSHSLNRVSLTHTHTHSPKARCVAGRQFPLPVRAQWLHGVLTYSAHPHRISAPAGGGENTRRHAIHQNRPSGYVARDEAGSASTRVCHHITTRSQATALSKTTAEQRVCLFNCACLHVSGEGGVLTE